MTTLLSRRYIEIKMLPLSLKEYVEHYKKDNYEKLYLDYINRSSFPYTINLEIEKEIDDYLESIYNTIILKDIVSRKKADYAMIQSVTRFMFSNIDNLLFVKK